MVTKGYQKGVYEWVTEGTRRWAGRLLAPSHPKLYARTMAESMNTTTTSTAGFGSFRRTFHTTMLMTDPPRGGARE